MADDTKPNDVAAAATPAETPEAKDDAATDAAASEEPSAAEDSPPPAAEPDRADAANGQTKSDDPPNRATETKAENGGKPAAVVSSSKKTRPPFKYDPNKITLRFLFANKDGLTVTVDCKPADTIGQVKESLLSVWPDDLPKCAGSDYLRLICMGKGMLTPDSKTLDECQIPVFKTHPTPVNVSVRPAVSHVEQSSSTAEPKVRRDTSTTATPPPSDQASQGCACIIL